MHNEILEDLAERVEYLSMMIQQQPVAPMMVQGTAYQPTAPAQPDLWNIIDPSNKITDRVVLTAPPYTEFTNQLQILNIQLLFINAVITDIFKPAPTFRERARLMTDKTVFSVDYIRKKSATDIDNLVQRVNNEIQEQTSTLLGPIGEEIKTVFDSSRQQYTEYTKAILDTVMNKIRRTPTITATSLTTEFCTQKRRTILNLGSSHDSNFKLKTCSITLENTGTIQITPNFSVGTDMQDDPTIRARTPVSAASTQINQVLPSYPPVPTAQTQMVTMSTPGATPTQYVPQYVPTNHAQMLPPQGMPMQPAQMLPPQIMPTHQPGIYPQVNMQHQLPNSSQPIPLTQTQLDQATNAAQQMAQHIPGAGKIIENISNTLANTQPNQSTQPQPQQQTRAQRRVAAALRNVQAAQDTVKAAQNALPTQNTTTSTPNTDNTKTDLAEEKKRKLAEIKESKQKLIDEQTKAKEQLKTQQEEENRAKRDELNKKKKEELAAQEAAKEKLKQQQEADALAKKQKRAEEKEKQKAADLAKQAELKKQHEDKLAKAKDDNEKEKLRKEHEEAEKKMKKEQEKAAKEAKAARAKEKKQLEDEQKAAAKKLKKEQEQAAKEAKDARAKAKKKLEEEQKQARKEQKEAQDKAAKEAKAQRAAQKEAVRGKSQKQGGGKKKK
jgi:hypothetical protein